MLAQSAEPAIAPDLRLVCYENADTAIHLLFEEPTIVIIPYTARFPSTQKGLGRLRLTQVKLFYKVHVLRSSLVIMLDE